MTVCFKHVLTNLGLNFIVHAALISRAFDLSTVFSGHNEGGHHLDVVLVADHTKNINIYANELHGKIVCGASNFIGEI